MARVSLFVERYAYPRQSARVDVPATLVGRLAVHKSAFWGDGELPDARALTARGKWAVSHAATGLQACPPDVKNWLATKDRKTAISFSERWQEASPEFFDALDGLPPEFFVNPDAIAKRPDIRALMISAIDAARVVKDTLSQSWDL